MATLKHWQDFIKMYNMWKLFSNASLICVLLFFRFNIGFSQAKTTDSPEKFKTISAGDEYKSSGLHKWLWGRNYRNVWTTPVKVRVMYLDTAEGGLKPTTSGGGNQTKKLHLKNNNDKEYSLRSVDKTLGKVLPEEFLGTFIEDQVNDEVSMSNPYGAATIPYLSQSAKIFHTNPEYVYLPKQAALENYNDTFGNNLYLFEQRLDGNWKEADNLGNFDSTVDTEEMLDSLESNNVFKVDQTAFIRLRLFDMFINDFDRHEGQWRWGAKKSGDNIIYFPVPQDRDQAYFKHDGLILNLAIGVSGLKFLQSFDDNLKNVKTFNYAARNLDRRLLNETTLDEWESIAKDLQQSLTDHAIENAIHNLPPEIYPLIGNDIIAKLKARRTRLAEWASAYYYFISKEVEIPGSKKNDEFDIENINPGETIVNVYKLDDNGKKSDSAFYSRVFKSSETNEIRLFGLKGEDKYIFNQSNDNNIKIKIIASSKEDSIIDLSLNKKIDDVIVYGKNNIKSADDNQLQIKNDTTFRSYRYNYYMYDKNGFVPKIFYSYEDRLYVGLGYKFKHYAWDKQPFASTQLIDYHFSLMEKSYSITYSALFPNLFAHSDFTLLANYDNIRWKYFFGLGNDSKFSDAHNIKYYTLRTRRWNFQPGIIKTFGNSTISVFGTLNGAEVLNDTDRFISKGYSLPKSGYEWKSFAGGGINYSFQHLNDDVVPTKGLYFNAGISGASNIKNSTSHYFDYSGAAHFYIPLVSKFSLNIRAGAEKITGNPEFYQYATIGGPTMRGVRRDRYWGKTAFYNTNDLRFISPVHTYIFNGKAGLLVFFDNGRVWMPGENSSTWHTGVGGGIILVPFDFIYVDATYGVSENKEHQIQVRITTYLKRKK